MLVASVWKTGSKTTTGSDPTDNLMPFDSPQPKNQTGREQVLARSYNPSPTDVLSCGEYSGGGELANHNTLREWAIGEQVCPAGSPRQSFSSSNKHRK